MGFKCIVCYCPVSFIKHDVGLEQDVLAKITSTSQKGITCLLDKSKMAHRFICAIM